MARDLAQAAIECGDFVARETLKWLRETPGEYRSIPVGAPETPLYQQGVGELLRRGLAEGAFRQPGSYWVYRSVRMPWDPTHAPAGAKTETANTGETGDHMNVVIVWIDAQLQREIFRDVRFTTEPGSYVIVTASATHYIPVTAVRKAVVSRAAASI